MITPLIMTDEQKVKGQWPDARLQTDGRHYRIYGGYKAKTWLSALCLTESAAWADAVSKLERPLPPAPEGQ